MMDEKEIETRNSLVKINKVCKFISIAIKIIFVLISVYWIFAASLMFLTFFDPSVADEVGGASAIKLVIYLAYGAIVVMMFVSLNGIFSDVAKGNSPFAMIQVKRLRSISAALLLYAIFDIVIAYNSAIMQFGGFNTGYITASGNAIVPINLATFIAAAVVFAFSFVFKYGVLLQEFSDDTI
ncbi:MAG: hypothetical protein RRZ85_10490 [Gordonibacter sp.]|uniref:hypothetical protein n=1 Tax=Gordonibacter sp. TaxID=1968902 RepID=UPI002FC847C9